MIFPGVHTGWDSIHTQVHILEQFSLTSSQTWILLEDGRKLENPNENHVDMERTCDPNKRAQDLTMQKVWCREMATLAIPAATYNKRRQIKGKC